MKGFQKTRFGPRVPGALHGQDGWREGVARRGFTIVELLVAMSITMLMMFLINRLFFDTVNAVGQGMALNHILSDSRTISDQLHDDAQGMVGPSVVTTQDRGFLVIINQVIQGVQIKGETNLRNVRSDQLVFIRDAQGLEPLAPGNVTSFSNSSDAAYTRVWYGHLRRTLPDGTDSGVLGANTAGNLNEVGSDWIIGRHALYLDGSLGWLPSGASAFRVYAQDATFDSAVYYAGTTPIPIATMLTYMALTDVCDQTLNSLTGPAGNLVGGPGAPFGTYYNYTFVTNRLRVNPMPDGMTFDSWRIAQMHPYLMEHVSDFIVEFAADLDNDGDLDVDSNGDLEWYGLDNAPGEPPPPPPLPPSPPNWSVGYPNVPNLSDGGSTDLPNLTTTDARFVFYPDYPDNWPYLIRIRYRLHDPKGKFKEHVYSVGGNVQAESGMWFEQIIKVNRD